jgi:hypothetical protein
MKLRKKPIKPKSLPVTPAITVARSEMPDAWLSYCSGYEGSEQAT